VPFEDENIGELYKKIVSGDYLLPSGLSPGLKDLIARMLQVDPRARIDMAGIK